MRLMLQLNCERPRLSASSYKYNLDQAATNPAEQSFYEVLLSPHLPYERRSRRLLCLSERELPVPITWGGSAPLSNAAAITSAGKST